MSLMETIPAFTLEQNIQRLPDARSKKRFVQLFTERRKLVGTRFFDCLWYLLCKRRRLCSGAR